MVDVVIVDDASSDDSLAVARGFAASDPRVTVIAHGKNTGPVQTFNDGLAEVRGEFLVRLDADDLLTPGSLERAVAVARRYPSVGLIYGHPLHFSGDTLPAPRTRATRWTIWPGREWLADRCRTGVNVITSPEVVMRTSVVNEVGGQEPLSHTHDMEMWFRLSAFADVAYIHGADQAWHREHGKGISRNVDSYRDLVERRDAFRVLFEGPASWIPEAGRLSALSMETIAAQAIDSASHEYDRGRANPELVDKLIEIARSAVPNVETVRGWSGLKRRMAIGSPRTARHPRFFLDRVLRRLLSMCRWHRWHRTGVF
jgi:hypothetical protein